MTPHKHLVERYFDGFRTSDHAQILDCLHDDVVWDLPGHTRLVGKAQFDSEIENPNFEGSPELDVDRLVEEGPTIVAVGEGRGRLVGGDPVRFAFCTVLTFGTDDLIERVESYVVPLT